MGEETLCTGWGDAGLCATEVQEMYQHFFDGYCSASAIPPVAGSEAYPTMFGASRVVLNG
jgi:hypothetical protein